jgi:hypothetical protein
MNENKHLLDTGEPKINEDNFNNNVEQREDSLSHIISVLYRWISYLRYLLYFDLRGSLDDYGHYIAGFL